VIQIYALEAKSLIKISILAQLLKYAPKQLDDVWQRQTIEIGVRACAL
jgi:hypothetical protein